MKRIPVVLAFLLCSAVTSAAAGAASPAGSIQPWLGTWSCNAGSKTHTQTFTSIFGGKAMRITDTGDTPSEQIVTFDSKSGKWIDQYADASGMSTVMQGTPSGKSIRFVQVYPSAGPVLVVTMPDSKTYTSAFTMTSNGKRTTQNETCKK